MVIYFCQDLGPLPDHLLHMPGFVDLLTAHTLATAPYPNRPLAFAGALTMLSHLTGRNFRDPRNRAPTCICWRWRTLAWARTIRARST